MKRLRRAIYTLFDATPSLEALVDDLYYTEAPEGTPYPYATFAPVIDTKEPRFSGRGQNILVRFNFFVQKESADDVETMADAFDAVFDECKLTVTGRSFGFFGRESRTQIKVDGVWQESILYRCLLEQND